MLLWFFFFFFYIKDLTGNKTSYCTAAGVCQEKMGCKSLSHFTDPKHFPRVRNDVSCPWAANSRAFELCTMEDRLVWFYDWSFESMELSFFSPSSTISLSELKRTLFTRSSADWIAFLICHMTLIALVLENYSWTCSKIRASKYNEVMFFTSRAQVSVFQTVMMCLAKERPGPKITELFFKTVKTTYLNNWNIGPKYTRMLSFKKKKNHLDVLASMALHIVGSRIFWSRDICHGQIGGDGKGEMRRARLKTIKFPWHGIKSQ